MFRPRFLFPLLILALGGLTGCATDRPISRADRARVRTVAVNYAPPAGIPESSSGERSVAGRIARHGVSIGLSALNLGTIGMIGGLATEFVEFPGSSGNRAVSPAVLAALGAAGTDPVLLVARRTEEQIRRQRLFVLQRANPDAVFHFDLERADLAPVDKAGLAYRPRLAVVARLRTGKGTTIWSRRLAAESGVVRTWQEYRDHPGRLKADFDGLAGGVARQLAAEFRR